MICDDVRCLRTRPLPLPPPSSARARSATGTRTKVRAECPRGRSCRRCHRTTSLHHYPHLHLRRLRASPTKPPQRITHRRCVEGRCVSVYPLPLALTELRRRRRRRRRRRSVDLSFSLSLSECFFCRISVDRSQS